MVALKLVERLSDLDALDRFDGTLIGEEPYPVYDRIHLTEWLDHGDFGRLALGREGWSEVSGIRTLTGERVIAIDRKNCTVHTERGLSVSYDRLVLATGAAAFRPPIEGADHDGVFVYRTLDDLKQIGAHSATVSSAAVVGGGILGIETAEALQRRGLDVTLLESGPFLMKRQLDPETAAHLEQALAGKGIPTVTGARAQRIDADGHRPVLTYSDSGESLVAGMIVFAAGVRPRDELARQSGLDVDPLGGGIVVDDRLLTTEPAIHAIGDRASHDGVSYGLVAPGYRMSETLAEILAGRKRRFSGFVPVVRLRLSGIDVWALGKPDERGVRVNWSGDGRLSGKDLQPPHRLGGMQLGRKADDGETQRFENGGLVRPERLEYGIDVHARGQLDADARQQGRECAPRRIERDPRPGSVQGCGRPVRFAAHRNRVDSMRGRFERPHREAAVRCRWRFGSVCAGGQGNHLAALRGKHADGARRRFLCGNGQVEQEANGNRPPGSTGAGRASDRIPGNHALRISSEAQGGATRNMDEIVPNVPS